MDGPTCFSLVIVLNFLMLVLLGGAYLISLAATDAALRAQLADPLGLGGITLVVLALGVGACLAGYEMRRRRVTPLQHSLLWCSLPLLPMLGFMLSNPGSSCARAAAATVFGFSLVFSLAFFAFVTRVWSAVVVLIALATLLHFSPWIFFHLFDENLNYASSGLFGFAIATLFAFMAPFGGVAQRLDSDSPRPTPTDRALAAIWRELTSAVGAGERTVRFDPSQAGLNEIVFTVKTEPLAEPVERAAVQVLKRAGLSWCGPRSEVVMDAAILLSEAGIAVHGIVRTGGGEHSHVIPLNFPGVQHPVAP